MSSVTVRAIIKKDQKILLLRRANGQYELPGGKATPANNAKEALRQHVFRDIGIEPSVIQLLYVVDYARQEQPDEPHSITVFAVGLDRDAAIHLGNEHTKFVWASLSNIHQYQVGETTLAALKLRAAVAQTDEAHDHTIDIDDKIATPMAATATSTTELFVYSDGGSRGNPGPSAAGFVLLDQHQQPLFKGGAYLGITTSSQAEYQAVRLCLQKALELGATTVHFRVDSLMVANQMNGVYDVKNRDLWPVHAAIKQLIGRFKKVTFEHVGRELNEAADAMVNRILDEYDHRD